ncbi:MULTISPECIES: hypothetical protein [unclassified Caballeronia]|uniref:hypothetical protein n=1 Tax=unclassified Caballeronia TaxID=2646786 RepID=UPI00285F6657|nr:MULTISPECIES: hypothetical protein [unclassified Caballeronia]MDR5775593.1 hypothetical protein [Caballeronia sp. LZ002]MDR5802312.1 hypothetical protein [Caballeronia sp. LZ001]MDR5851031.1 hypothetical protein [Caballeronia sp. LZ003]
MGIGLGFAGLGLAGFTAGASIAAAGGILAAIESASAVSLAVGTAGIVADAAAIASGAVEDCDLKASGVLDWVSLAAAGIGLLSGGIRAAKLSGPKTRYRNASITWGGPMRLKGVGPSSYIFEDTYKGEARLNVIGHSRIVADTLYLDVTHEYAASPLGLANFLYERFSLNRFSTVRLITCHGANGGEHSFAAQFARIIRKPVKAYEGCVSTTIGYLPMAMVSLFKGDIGLTLWPHYNLTRRIAIFNNAEFSFLMNKANGFYHPVRFDSGGRVWNQAEASRFPMP